MASVQKNGERSSAEEVKPTALSNVELVQLNQSLRRANERVSAIAQDAPRESNPAVVRKLKSLPIELHDGITTSSLAEKGVKIELRNGVLVTPIQIERYGPDQSPANIHFDSNTSHVVLSNGRKAGTFELRIVNKSRDGEHTEQSLIVARDGTTELRDEKRLQDRSHVVRGQTPALNISISPQQHPELYNALVASEARGMQFSIVPKRPGVVSFEVANALGKVLASKTLDTFEIDGATKIPFNEKTADDVAQMLTAVNASKYAVVPENLQAALTQLKQESLTLKVELQKAAIYRVVNALGTELGEITFGGIDADARSNLPNSEADRDRLLEFLQRTIERSRFAK